MKKNIIIGICASAVLFLVYTGIITWAEGFEHAMNQAASNWYLVMPLVVGFGIQAGLFSFIRFAMREKRAATTASVAATGGMSAGSMAACCAHHLTDVLPLLGMSGLAAFLANYQTVFMFGGILSNVIGITVMLEVIQHHGLSSHLSRLGWRMNRVKKNTIISAALLFAAILVLNIFVPLSGSG